MTGKRLKKTKTLSTNDVEVWIARRGFSAETARVYRRAARAFVEHARPGTTGWEERAARFRRSLQDRGLSSATQAGYVVGARLFLAWAVDEKLVEENPLDEVSVPITKGLPRLAPDEDVLALAASIKGDDEQSLRDRALIFLMAYTGLRASIVAGILVGDVDRSRDPPVLRYRGGRNTSKSRSVEVHPDAMAALDKYLGARDRPPDDAPLFCVPRGTGARIRRASLRKTINERSKKAGIMTRGTLWHKGVLSWTEGQTLYLSVVFTWQVEEARRLAERHAGPVVAGGPGMMLVHPGGCGWAEVRREAPLDVLSMHNPIVTRTSRGCPRRCGFCAVQRLHPEFQEFPDFRPAPIVIDDNFLACSRAHVERAVERLSVFDEVDFNQGLDARLFGRWHARLFRHGLRRVSVRFSLDRAAQRSAVERAVALCREEGLPVHGVFVLVGWRDDPEDALKRINAVREMKVAPFLMRYQPLDATRKDDHLGKGWTEQQMLDIVKQHRGVWLNPALRGVARTGARDDKTA